MVVQDVIKVGAVVIKGLEAGSRMNWAALINSG